MRSLLNEAWLSASTLLVIIGLVAGSVILVGVGVLIVTLGGAARLWARLSLEEVEYGRELAERRAFVGERVELRLRLANRKALPVPWIEVRQQLPEALAVEGAHVGPSGIAGVVMLERTTSLVGHERVEWRLSLVTSERGYFRIGPARLRSGDLFGIFDREETVPGGEALVVYPRTYTLDDLGLGSTRPFGELRGGQRIFEDPVRVVGVRDYLPGDPLKRVDWKATARAGRLQSRLYEPSRTQSVVIALNISTMEHSWQGANPVVLERGVVVAASIASWAFEAGFALGFVANGSFPNADRPIRIGAGRRPDQLVHVLEALAMISPMTTSELSEQLSRRRHTVPAGASLIVVAARMPEELAAALLRHREEGYDVHVVKTSSESWDVSLGAVPIIEIESRMQEIEREAGEPAPTGAAGTSGAAR